jgi:hypothetical protein
MRVVIEDCPRTKTGVHRMHICMLGVTCTNPISIWPWCVCGIEMVGVAVRIRDACERCYGERGGVRGNENVVDGVVLCDYCHCDDLRAAR